MKKMRIFVLSILIVFLLSITVFADGKVSSSNLFLFGEDVGSSKQVMGDVYAFAQGIDIEESVNGDVISIGQYISIKADRILGNIRCAGQSLDIDVGNTKNITVAGQDISIDEDTVANATYAAGQNIEFKGTTNDLSLVGQDIVVDGIVNGDLDLRGYNITITENTVVLGSIVIKSENEPNIKGSVAWKDIDYEQIDYKSKINQSKVGVIPRIMNIVNAVIVGLIMFLIGRNYFSKLNKDVNLYLGKAILIGLCLIIGIPICILTLIFSLVGTPIGLIVLSAYLSILYLSPMFTGIIIGEKLLKNQNQYIQVVGGIVFIKILVLIPYIGTILRFYCNMFMMGSLFIYALEYFKLKKYK